MTGTRGSPATPSGDIQLIARDLATISGALSEIATTWRRARACRPDLPPGLPQRLADTAQHLAAETRLLAETSQGRASGMPAALAQEMSALREDIAAARAMTAGPGDPGVGDAGLWEYLGPAPSS
jgi:hypothetical protein